VEWDRLSFYGSSDVLRADESSDGLVLSSTQNRLPFATGPGEV
jgi:hypothetical protein